jgi:cysteinyl-tRNA synthetase
MRGRKMSKSAGNFQRITELGEDGLDPLAFRYLCLTSRYARKLNLSDRSIAAAAAGLESLRAELVALGPAPASAPWAAPAPLVAGASPDRPAGVASRLTGHGEPTGLGLADRASSPSAPLSPAGRALHDQFTAAIDDDLDTPAALRIARQTLRAKLPADERRWLVLDMVFVLGLDLHRSTAVDLPAGAAELLAARAKARADRDFAAADRLREELRQLGVEPIDLADGTSDWRRLRED